MSVRDIVKQQSLASMLLDVKVFAIDDRRFGGVKQCPYDLYPSAERYCNKYNKCPGEPICTACWDQDYLIGHPDPVGEPGPLGDKGEPGERAVLTEEQQNELKVLAEKTFETTY